MTELMLLTIRSIKQMRAWSKRNLLRLIGHWMPIITFRRPSLAILQRLDVLPVPIKDIIKLVAKKLARIRKHETRAVADAASALIAKWCAHYNSTAPPVSPRAQKPP